MPPRHARLPDREGGRHEGKTPDNRAADRGVHGLGQALRHSRWTRSWSRPRPSCKKTPRATKGSPAPGYYKVMMSSRVSYADLDLAKATDVATLEWRINEASKVVCEKLGKAYPDSGPDTKQCAKRAADKAMTEARKVIAARR